MPPAPGTPSSGAKASASGLAGEGEAKDGSGSQALLEVPRMYTSGSGSSSDVSFPHSTSGSGSRESSGGLAGDLLNPHAYDVRSIYRGAMHGRRALTASEWSSAHPIVAPPCDARASQEEIAAMALELEQMLSQLTDQSRLTTLQEMYKEVLVSVLQLITAVTNHFSAQYVDITALTVHRVSEIVR